MEELDLTDIRRRMENSVEILKTEFSGLRTGRASANMFETINVNVVFVSTRGINAKNNRFSS